MAEQYSKKTSNDTVVHYGSREEMEAASDRSAIIWISVIAFFAGGAAAFFALASLKIAGLPTWAKFVAVLASAICSSYIGWKLGKIILYGIVSLILLALLYAAGSLVWNLVANI